MQRVASLQMRLARLENEADKGSYPDWASVVAQKNWFRVEETGSRVKVSSPYLFEDDAYVEFNKSTGSVTVVYKDGREIGLREASSKEDFFSNRYFLHVLDRGAKLPLQRGIRL